MNDLQHIQMQLCHKYGAAYEPVNPQLKVGISFTLLSGIVPFNGLRHQPEGDTCGWYLWGGEEWSTAADFFQPLHVYHLADQCPFVLPYLALPPGWRFLSDGAYEDVWFDAALLHSS